MTNDFYHALHRALKGVRLEDVFNKLNLAPYFAPLEIPVKKKDYWVPGHVAGANAAYFQNKLYQALRIPDGWIDEWSDTVRRQLILVEKYWTYPYLDKLEPQMVSVEVLKSLLDLYDQLKDDNAGMAEGIKIAVMAGLNDYMRINEATQPINRPGFATGEVQKDMRANPGFAMPKVAEAYDRFHDEDTGEVQKDMREDMRANRPDAPGMTQDEHELANAGEKIQAIKSIRARYALGIKRG
jgi:hypothetical protein